MANTMNTRTAATEDNKVLKWEQFQKYNTKIQAKMAADDATVLQSAKDYADGLAGDYDAAGTAQTKVNELANGAVKANTDAITKLNGDETVEDSVDKKIKDASDTLEQKITDSTYDDTAIQAKVTANETAIGVLNGTGDGSVAKKVADEIAKVVAGADESMDTLKEIADWISTHADSASAMNTQINANKDDIAALKGLVTQLPEGSDAENLIEYITNVVNSAKEELTTDIATAKTEAVTEAGTNADTKIATKVGDIGEVTVKAYVDTAKTDAATDATTKSNQALTDAKAYTDELTARVEELESVGAVTDADIDSLFPSTPAGE